LNGYVSYATGYKASSVNLSRDSAPSVADFTTLRSLGLLPANAAPGTRFADPEEAKVYELGLKARFDRGSLNIAVFDQTVENFQSNIFTGNAFSLLNAEEQSVKGAEVSFSYSPTDSFSYGINVTYLDPLYDSFTNSATGDLSGQVPAGISEISASLSAQYDFEFSGNEAYIRGDYQYEDDVQIVDGISADIASREVKLLNVSAGMTTESGLGFTLWARNLADESYLISAFPSVAQTGSISGYRNEPRTFGVTVRKDF
jgi:outer membrane receptor protein involved in Fe transport